MRIVFSTDSLPPLPRGKGRLAKNSKRPRLYVRRPPIEAFFRPVNIAEVMSPPLAEPYHDHCRQMQHNDAREYIKSIKVARRDRTPEGAHRLECRLIDLSRGERRHGCRTTPARRNPAGKPRAEGRPEQVGAGENKSSRDLNNEQKEQGCNSETCCLIVTDVILRLAGQEGRNIRSQRAPVPCTARQYGTPSSVPVPDKRPCKAPDQINAIR